MVDGFCFLRDMEDYFEFDAQRHRLRGRKTGKVIQLGLPVDVKIAGVDWKAQEMDLLLVNGKLPSSAEPKKKKEKKEERWEETKKERKKEVKPNIIRQREPPEPDRSPPRCCRSGEISAAGRRERR